MMTNISRGYHRVVMVLASPFPAPRGTQAWISELASALVRLGHEVHIFCYGGSLGGVVPDGLEVHRAPLVPGVAADLDSAPTLARPINDLGLLAKLVAAVERVKPTVVHGHNHEGGIAAALASRFLGIPCVHQIHGSLAEELNAWVGAHGRPPRALASLAAACGVVLDAAVPRLADWVLTLDADAADRVRATLRRSPGTSRSSESCRSPMTRLLEGPRGVTPLPPGVTIYRTMSPRRDVLPGEGPWVVYPGNLDPYQSLDVLFGAWAIVRERLPQAGLALVTHDEPRDLPMPRGVRVIRARSREEARALLAAATATVIPRTGGGGYPVKLLNSLGQGVPVVACRPAAKGLGLTEGVLPCEPTAAGLADGLVRVLGDSKLSRELSHAAADFAAANPWSEVARAVSRVYDAVADPSL